MDVLWLTNFATSYAWGMRPVYTNKFPEELRSTCILKWVTPIKPFYNLNISSFATIRRPSVEKIKVNVYYPDINM